MYPPTVPMYSQPFSQPVPAVHWHFYGKAMSCTEPEQPPMNKIEDIDSDIDEAETLERKDHGTKRSRSRPRPRPEPDVIFTSNHTQLGYEMQRPKIERAGALPFSRSTTQRSTTGKNPSRPSPNTEGPSGIVGRPKRIANGPNEIQGEPSDSAAEASGITRGPIEITGGPRDPRSTLWPKRFACKVETQQEILTRAGAGNVKQPMTAVKSLTVRGMSRAVRPHDGPSHGDGGSDDV